MDCELELFPFRDEERVSIRWVEPLFFEFSLSVSRSFTRLEDFFSR